MVATNSPNHFIKSQSPQDRDLLEPHLKPLQLPRGAPIFRTTDIIPYVYFPHTCIVSFIVGVESGQHVEAGLLGRNGVVGAGAALDGPDALNTAMIQAESTGAMIEAKVAKSFPRQSETPGAKIFGNSGLILGSPFGEEGAAGCVTPISQPAAPVWQKRGR
jgi:hypothetical protein